MDPDAAADSDGAGFDSVESAAAAPLAVEEGEEYVLAV
jgi:hypothetical protein